MRVVSGRFASQAAVSVRVVFGFGAATLAGCAAPHESPRPRVEAERREWKYLGASGVEFVTPHYRLRTTCVHESLLRSLPEFVEACWDEYATLVPPHRELSSPAETYLFQTRGQWEHFTQKFSPLRAATYLKIRSGGYEERGVTVSHYDRMATTFSVLAHEGLHQFLSRTRGGRIPPWVNEGLACQFEAFDLDADGRPSFTPRRNLIRRNTLRDAYLTKQMFELQDLFATDAGRVVALPSPRVRAYYGQVWSLVLFLREDCREPALQPFAAGFTRLLEELGTPRMMAAAAEAASLAGRPNMDYGEAVFRAYVTTDVAAFQQHYLAFVRAMLSVD
ncbi:MAG: DUF1570 domain-containing protein [Phycisphaerae bacterium]|nr:DUF1570 domain-containing protein [Phycisphaerae bacterium]